MSLPAGGAWIETQILSLKLFGLKSRSPQGGAWIEIVSLGIIRSISFGRSPQGERGLKSGRNVEFVELLLPLPAGPAI